MVVHRFGVPSIEDLLMWKYITGQEMACALSYFLTKKQKFPIYSPVDSINDGGNRDNGVHELCVSYSGKA
jgi:hypothetical protein